MNITKYFKLLKEEISNKKTVEICLKYFLLNTDYITRDISSPEEEYKYRNFSVDIKKIIM